MLTAEALKGKAQVCFVDDGIIIVPEPDTDTGLLHKAIEEVQEAEREIAEGFEKAKGRISELALSLERVTERERNETPKWDFAMGERNDRAARRKKDKRKGR